MRYAAVFIVLIFSFLKADASHIVGGEMVYEYIGSAGPNKKSYRVTLWLFRDESCANCADMPSGVMIGIYNNDNLNMVGGFRSVSRTNTNTVPQSPLPLCTTNPPNQNYRAASYVFTVDLWDNQTGYTVSYQTCCRINGIQNIANGSGATYAAQIPGLSHLGATGTDNSPKFAQTLSLVCYKKPFSLDFSATDTDPDDSLVYIMCGAFGGGDAMDASYGTPGGPPYAVLNYTNGYDGFFPLGTQANINEHTGIISGIAPDPGRYVVSVCINVYRNGRYITRHRKDFIITVAACDFAGAELQPSYKSCDGFTFDFENLISSPLNATYFWDFGDGNTSVLSDPSHTYTTAGIYTVKLVVNRGGSCADSTTSELRVFPGYFPAFTTNSPMCKGVPVSFTDATVANYGASNRWRWDFGDPSTVNDVSTVQNPTYIYNTPGTYYVELEVESDKGCIGTFRDSVIISERPEFSITKDTLICSIDSIKLYAYTNTPGNITWSPNYNISNVNSFSPVAWPDVTTTYVVNYNDNFGCSATDKVTVKVVDTVTLIAMRDTTICTTDAVTLQLNSDAHQYEWTPAATLNDASIQNPVATPLTTTTYTVVGRIGRCNTTDQVKITTVPYPLVTVSPDTSICFGINAPLRATGGSIYSWSPVTYLSAANIPDPVAIRPSVSLNYTVTVRDVLGCPKPVSKTIRLTVVKIIANAGPADTSVVLGQPLQLNATGSEFYSWSPSTWLSNAFIPDPVSFPQDDIQYKVRVSNAAGCFGEDTINVKVYKIEPDILVPSGFTPNGDGNNDVFRPIPIGMNSLHAFRVYNRWGQMLFSTTEPGQGWDGMFGGRAQEPATYVWYAEGVDYLGKKIQRKGYVILIR